MDLLGRKRRKRLREELERKHAQDRVRRAVANSQQKKREREAEEASPRADQRLYDNDMLTTQGVFMNDIVLDGSREINDAPTHEPSSPPADFTHDTSGSDSSTYDSSSSDAGGSFDAGGSDGGSF